MRTIKPVKGNRTLVVRGYKPDTCQSFAQDTTGNMKEARQIASRMIKAGCTCINIDTTLEIIVVD